MKVKRYMWRSVIFNKQRMAGIIRQGMLAAGIGGGALNAGAVNWSYLDNGTVKIGVDRDRGACIGWFSPSGGANLLNNYDNGRFIQQSYYGDTDGSYWNTTPWRYNPVQGGGWQNQWPAQLLGFSNSGGRIYAKTRPCHWATGALLPEVVMEQWISLKNSIAHVHYKMSYSGNSQAYFGGQEMPAVFVDYGLSDLVFYSGIHPWKNEALTSVSVPGLTTPVGTIYNRSEHWAAYVHPVHRGGIGVYTPDTVRMTSYRYLSGSGATGPTAPSCSYFAPVRFFALKSGCSVEYDLFITTGTETNIRNNFYGIRAAGFDADNDGIDDVWEYQRFGSVGTASGSSDYDADGIRDVDESAAGTDPKDAQSGFRVRFGRNQPLSWEGDWNRRYVVRQASSLLTPGSGVDVYTNYSGNPALNAFVPKRSEPAAFFRVTAWKDAAAQVPGWDFNQFAQGIPWRIGTMDSLEVTNGVLRGVFSSSANNIVTDTSIPMLLDADSYAHMSIRMKNGSASGKMAIRFIRSTDSAWDNLRLVNMFPSTFDTDFKTYELDMSSNTNWHGSIKRLRFNLPNATSGSFEIDYVMFH